VDDGLQEAGHRFEVHVKEEGGQRVDEEEGIAATMEGGGQKRDESVDVGVGVRRQREEARIVRLGAARG
jgi:thymidine phosphorylase